MAKLKVYHGSHCEVKIPDLDKSRVDIDFGAGFYVTEDEQMAKKWACNKKVSVLNEYELSYNGLKTINLDADEKWFDYVLFNRRYDTQIKEPEELKECDVIIGPTADDRMFFLFDLYDSGLVNKQNAIKILNCMNYSEQIVLKTDRAIQMLQHIESKMILGKEKKDYLLAYREDSQNGIKKANELLRQINRGMDCVR